MRSQHKHTALRLAVAVGAMLLFAATTFAQSADDAADGKSGPQLNGASGDTPPLPDPERQVAPPAELSGARAATMTLEERVVRLERLIEGQSAKLEEMATAVQLQQIRDDIAGLSESIQSMHTALRVDPSGVQPAPQIPGKLVLENRTRYRYIVRINGYDFTINPGRNELNVLVGEVVTEIRGYEAPQRWTAENFRQVGDVQQLAIQIQ